MDDTNITMHVLTKEESADSEDNSSRQLYLEGPGLVESASDEKELSATQELLLEMASGALSAMGSVVSQHYSRTRVDGKPRKTRS